MGVVSGGACAERRMCRHLVAPSCENQFFSDSRAFLTLVLVPSLYRAFDLLFL